MRSARPRLKRVNPDRCGPIRNPAQRMGATPGWGPVEWGVKTAYTVIDEYMRRGRDAACGFGQHANWRRDMSDNRCGYGGYGSSNPYAAWGPMWPFLAPWMQAMQAWSCAMSGFVPAPVAQPSWSECATVPKVSVKVQSKHRTEVTVCVDAGADSARLTADPLKTQKVDEPWLHDVKIEAECGHVRIVVKVPDDQPAGVYRGMIRDGSGCKRGELIVDISK